MLGKYLAENVIRIDDEYFTDADTGEYRRIQRKQKLFNAGTYIDQDTAQKIAFSIQADEIKDVLVCDRPKPLERLIFPDLTKWEVTLSYFMDRKTFLVRAQTLENAVIIATEYCSIYKAVNQYITPIAIKAVAYTIIDEDPEPDDDNNVEDQDYYKVLIHHEYIDADRKLKTIDTKLIVSANEVGEAKDKGKHWMDDEYRTTIEQHREFVRTASPYSAISVIPMEYCKRFFLPSNI